MKKYLSAVLIAAAFAAASPLSAQTVLLDEDFESYANTAAVVSVAPPDPPTTPWTTVGALELSTAQSVSGTQSMLQPASSTGTMNGGFTGVANDLLNDVENLVVTFHLFETDSATTPCREGLSFGSYGGGTWGVGTLNNFFSVGTYTSSSVANYGIRVVNGGSNWQATTFARKNGWTEITLTIDGSTVMPSFDGVDGLATADTYSLNAPTDEWNSVRFGSFVGVATGAQDMYYDDLSVVFNGGSNVNDWHMY